MNTLTALRAAAFVMAGIAVVDPSSNFERREPAAVEILSASGSPTVGSTDVARLRDRLTREASGGVVFDSWRKPSAAVMLGSHVDVDSIPSGLPVSTVGRDSSGANLAVIEMKTPAVLRAGWSTEVRVIVSARGMAGKTTTVALQEGGLELASARHAWTRADETVELPMVYIPSAAGSRELRAVARADDGEPTTDNQVMSIVAVQDRRLKILVHEPRPSWTAVFVRRALDAFARRRGGTVAYLAERRPSGAYADRLRLSGHNELLLPNPIRLAALAGPPLRGSEFIVVSQSTTGLDSLATIDQGGTMRPVIVSWPMGAGQIIFSGALDAWRYRGTSDGFARFWRAVIGAGAAKAPGRVTVTLDRGAVASGETVVVRARVRGTEFDETKPTVTMPGISARVVGGQGFDEAVRMWPSPELGEFEGRFVTPSAGRYDVRVMLDADASADTVLVVNDEARHHWASSDAAQTLAARTGGVAVDESDLRPLVDHLSRLAGAAAPATIHPARSPWWMLGFITLVSVEWLIRRKRGLR